MQDIRLDYFYRHANILNHLENLFDPSVVAMHVCVMRICNMQCARLNSRASMPCGRLANQVAKSGTLQLLSPTSNCFCVSVNLFQSCCVERRSSQPTSAGPRHGGVNQTSRTMASTDWETEEGDKLGDGRRAVADRVGKTGRRTVCGAAALCHFATCFLLHDDTVTMSLAVRSSADYSP